ncbi:MAG TPA: DUF3553 domain-containing protein [Vicinamibacterales bacterium]|nr:DUF3553 domain-containing protein [Vicinamibacterales bacterium]
MDQGDFVRHRARAEWGIGQVLARANDRIDVQFAHGLVPLKLSIATPFLEKVSAAEARAAGVVSTTRRTGAAKTASGVRRAPRAKKVVEPEPEAEAEEAEADEADE